MIYSRHLLLFGCLVFIPLPENTRFHENTGPVLAKQGARAPPPAMRLPPAMRMEPEAPPGGGSSTGLSWGLMELPQHDPDLCIAVWSCLASAC